MTGFGLARLSSPESNLEVNIRSVNSRFLELRFQVPRELTHLESKLRQRLGKSLRRGAVDIHIQRRVVDISQRLKVEVQVDVAQKWLKAYQSLSEELGLSAAPLGVAQLAAQHQVISLKEDFSSSADEEDFILKAFDQALSHLVEERRREGAALKKEILSLLTQLQKLLRRVQKLAKGAAALHQKKMESRLRKLLVEVVEPQRLAQEVAFLADRADIQEELMRLHEHIDNCLTLVMARQAEGKKIEFYVQELLRELNTIGSKSSQAELTALVVDGKSLIEKLKEQAANIE